MKIKKEPTKSKNVIEIKNITSETENSDYQTNNPKLHEIKNTKAINWKKFAENAKLNYTVLADVLSNRRHCTPRYAERLIKPLAEYNIIVTAEELTGTKQKKKERKKRKAKTEEK